MNDLGGVILDLDSGMVFSLNTVGAFVWNKLERSATGLCFAELVEVMFEEFKLPREQLGADLTSFLNELKMRRLLREA